MKAENLRPLQFYERDGVIGFALTGPEQPPRCDEFTLLVVEGAENEQTRISDQTWVNVREDKTTAFRALFACVEQQGDLFRNSGSPAVLAGRKP